MGAPQRFKTAYSRVEQLPFGPRAFFAMPAPQRLINIPMKLVSGWENG